MRDKSNRVRREMVGDFKEEEKGNRRASILSSLNLS